jgi:hypothetical protein
MKKNPFFNDVKPLSRRQLKEIQGGGAGQNADACLSAGEGCGATILACCPGLECVFKPPSFFGTCKAS